MSENYTHEIFYFFSKTVLSCVDIIDMADILKSISKHIRSDLWFLNIKVYITA